MTSASDIPALAARIDREMPRGRILALSGGVGGAKLALGLARVLPRGCLSIVVNTGDDFEYLGFHISPDIDTLLYTLSGTNNPDTGWGRDNESWSFMSELERLGVDAWFRLGDKDLAVHALRNSWLQSGASLSKVTENLARRFRVEADVIPMSDDPVRTRVETDSGPMAFQEYFVRLQCKPAVSTIVFAGAAEAAPSPAFQQLLDSPSLAGVLICPSNPFLSVDPILSLPGVRDALQKQAAPIVAVSPIIGGSAVKGPTAKIMTELGIPVTAESIARHYGKLLDGFVIDSEDKDQAASIGDAGIEVLVTRTLMQTLGDRIAVAAATLELLLRLRQGTCA